ncbi:uncharacterized protein LOC131876542 [Cryptomeria japonica]|uniref:uncharacterized protein LOC131876542 n=1 Tax=Cryptomeria japonica TaxID=3369 RepID=UPI0027DA403D|nr:uncharacterized protein LOC131876542 [Cryptomeria japonica]
MSEKQAFKWNEEGNKEFESIKEAIAQAPILVNPYFKKDFIIYCYASEHTMSWILLQKNEGNEEVPISFMSVPLKKHELKYSLMEKQVYVVMKVVKQFRYYILHSHVVVYVPHSAVKRILTQQGIRMNNRASWVSKIQEFNLNIKPIELVRGQGLCKLTAESKNEMTEELPLVLFVGLQDSWFADVAYYLTYGDCLAHLSPREKWNLRLKAAKYVNFDDVLYKKGLDGTFLRCMFKDSYTWVAKCEKCKLFTGKPQLAALPLRPVVVNEPFKQRGLDFIGPLSLTSSAGHTHILVATDYFTKWVEAIQVRKMTSEIVCSFLKENILVRFGVPQKIMADNAANFSSAEISLFCYDHGISLTYSSDYYPQGNDQVELSNKNLINIMKKLVSENFKD